MRNPFRSSSSIPDRAARHHREQASTRQAEASVAAQRGEEARLKALRAKQEEQLARDEAEADERRAELHERGLADDELDRAHEGRTDVRARSTADDEVHQDNGRHTQDNGRHTQTDEELTRRR